MNIGIIGAGFTGLSAAYYLQKQGHCVTILEKDADAGGLAIGFKLPQWHWTLEEHYHHWFSNDTAVLKLAEEINHEVLLLRPKTSVYIDGSIYQLDSLLSVSTFPKLGIFDRLRMIAALGFFKVNPFWQPLEKFKTTSILPLLMGQSAYTRIWYPQLYNKFKDYTNDISLAWFWARVKKRTPKLAYPSKGFLAFARHLAELIMQNGTILFNTHIQQIQKDTYITVMGITNGKTKNYRFEKLIVTIPSPFFTKITPQLPKAYTQKLHNLKGLGAINLVLRLKKQFLTDDTYWLSICKLNSPIMAIVEHTNFIDKKHYNNEHIVYVGNYISPTDALYAATAEELLSLYDPTLKKLNPSYQNSLINIHAFKAPFAQPIIPTNYSSIIPSFDTPLKGIYLANIQQVYPWDRGTNYAISLGKKVVSHVLQS